MKYRVLVGCNYPSLVQAEAVRREIGDVVDDMPPGTIQAFLADHVIEQVGGKIELTEKPPAPTRDGASPPAPGPYHAKDGKSFHTRPDCKTGNNIEPETRLEGDGGLPKCEKCARLERSEGRE